MKEETKQLITWIENALNTYTSKNASMMTRDLCNDALTFLNSLPEIESHLCRGGYIQDCFERPCCDGDKIKIGLDVGNLYWSINDRRFYFKKLDTVYDLPIKFEKVEK